MTRIEAHPPCQRLVRRVALVTGGGQGIGRAIALCLAAEGADVGVNDVRLEAASRVAEEVRSLGRRAVPLIADVSIEEAVEGMFTEFFQTFDRLDILVNNAGIGPIHPLLDCTVGEWDRVFAVNVRSVFLCSQVAARQMIRQHYGCIVNAASVCGLRASPNFVPYCASKAAVIALTQGLAHELAPFGITVNAYCPGIIDTDMTASTNRKVGELLGLSPKEMLKRRLQNIPLGRVGMPEEVAELVVFLASDDARYITGQAIPVGGGLVMH
jgi:meso-butanediol dehydrogenase/(S,S)-butanediol dehydrogenase/diacetyl reductase